MAVKDYNQYFSPNLSEYSGKFTYAVDWNDTWKFRGGMWHTTKNFYGFGKLFSDLDDLKTFIKTFLTTTSVGQNPGPSKSDIDSMNEADAYAVLGSAIYNSNVKKGTIQGGGVIRPNSEAESALRTAIKHYKEYKNAVTALEEKGATPAQIQSFLQSDKVQTLSSTEWSDLASNIPTMSGSELASYGMDKPEDTGGDTEGDPDTDPPGIPISESESAVGGADTNAESVQTAATNTVLGDSSLDALRNYASENDLTLEEDSDNNSYVLKDADGKTINTFAVDNENNQLVYVGGEKDGQRFSVGGMPERADAMQDVEDTYFQEQQGLVDELGELRGEYDQYMTDTLAEFDEQDFAGQINAQLNQFLTGKDADGNDILDADGNPIKGFLDYQSDLEDAAGTYKTDMQSLQGMYDQAYSDYGSELQPLRGEMAGVRRKLGTVADASMDVARDAGDENYYGRLKDLYYQDAKEQIDRHARGARDTLNETYANAGLDPSSPAFTAAMTDLAQSRSDSLRSSRRQAILDSYGLGSQMLTNRSNALSSAGSALSNQMSGIGTEMNAVDSLYGVKLAGLNNRRDMIGQIYGADKDVAATGISGLNTVLNTNLQGINADQTQFNTKLGLNKDFYNTQFQNLGLQFDAFGNIRNTANQEGQDATESILDFNQDLNSDKFNYITLENMFKDRGENVPDWLKDELSNYGIK